MNCIHCQSEVIVKNGTKTLKTGQVLQQYLCNTCGRRFNERSGTPMARLRTPVTTVEMALNARHEGLGIRAVARVVGTSPSNITTWEERLSSHLPAWSPLPQRGARSPSKAMNSTPAWVRTFPPEASQGWDH
jgi:transposase-like protein